MLTISTPRERLLLVGFGIVLMVSLLWLLFGPVANRVNANGICLPELDDYGDDAGTMVAIVRLACPAANIVIGKVARIEFETAAGGTDELVEAGARVLTVEKLDELTGANLDGFYRVELSMPNETDWTMATHTACKIGIKWVHNLSGRYSGPG